MMDINYLNFQMNQLKEKHEVTDDRCLHGQSKHRKGLKSLPDVMQTFSLVCSSLFSKILFNQFQAILQVFSWQMRTHLLEWEKPLLYLSDNKKSDFFFFVPLGNPRLPGGRVCFERFHLPNSPLNKATLCSLSSFFARSSCCPETGIPSPE